MKASVLTGFVFMLLSFGAYAKPKTVDQNKIRVAQDITANTATLVCSKGSDGKLLCKPLESGDVEFTTKNLIILRGPIMAKTASKFIADFHTLEHKDEVQKIYIYVKSPGGSIFAGDYISNIISSSKKEVIVVIDFAASMAFHIAHFADKRLMIPTGTMMQHHASGSPGDGEFPNVDKRWNWIKRKVEMMKKHDAASCTNTSLKQFKENIDRDWWLLSDEALRAGCIDAIATRVTCSKDLINQHVFEEVSFSGINVRMKWSGCPLETYPRKVSIRRSTGFNDLTEKQRQLAEEYIMLVTDPLQYYNTRGSFDLNRFINLEEDSPKLPK